MVDVSYRILRHQLLQEEAKKSHFQITTLSGGVLLLKLFILNLADTVIHQLSALNLFQRFT